MVKAETSKNLVQTADQNVTLLHLIPGDGVLPYKSQTGLAKATLTQPGAANTAAVRLQLCDQRPKT